MGYFYISALIRINSTCTSDPPLGDPGLNRSTKIPGLLLDQGVHYKPRWYGTIKIPPCTVALRPNIEQKFCSPSQVMVTCIYLSEIFSKETKNNIHRSINLHYLNYFCSIHVITDIHFHTTGPGRLGEKYFVKAKQSQSPRSFLQTWVTWSGLPNVAPEYHNGSNILVITNRPRSY